ncbi:hypothetical protein [Marinobacter sp.]|uniref:hypothetical protein n=1 Tax=Marinobacter sp. TaxID=50741 RepID=UPI001B5CE64D|nr:hypothetical protein [Marinobacter sp.]MBQ0833234.1 hypothetical protein [Marinobacter sp.]
MSDVSISAGGACDKPKTLWVEVAGNGIESKHSLVLEKRGKTVTALSMEQRNDHQLYSCDYDVTEAERFDHTLTLELQKANGAPIRLPLLDRPKAAAKSARTQTNLLFPIYPVAQLPRTNGESQQALLRPGFIYVFWKGILWRELQNNSSGKMNDVDLAYWREARRSHNNINFDKRAAEGEELDTLWVPARFEQAAGAKWTIGDVEIAWSEVQWSWEYIESLESGRNILDLPEYYKELTGIPAYGKGLAEPVIEDRRTARCTRLSGLSTYDHRARFGEAALAADSWLPVSSLTPSRTRDPEREYQAAAPFHVTSSLDGSGLATEPNSRLQSLRTELEALEGYTCKVHETIDFAKGLSEWVREAMQKMGQAGAEKSESGLFSETIESDTESARQALLEIVEAALAQAPAEKDQLEAVRGNAIAAVPVSDVMFDLAWLTKQSSLELNYLSTLVESTQKHPHFKSAMLLHSALFDYRAHKRGPFDSYRGSVDTNKLDEALRTSDRADSRQAFYALIERRVQLLEASHTAAVFNDSFALNGIRSLLGQYTMNQVLVHLEHSVFTFDTLAGKAARSQEQLRDEGGARFIVNLNTPKAKLSRFLEFDSEVISLESDLPDTLEAEQNDGSGRPRLSLLRDLQMAASAPDDIPDGLKDAYSLAEAEREQVASNMAALGDAKLAQWVGVSYTSQGQFVADVTSEFYRMTQAALLRLASESGISKHKDSIQVAAKLMKAGNPFFRTLRLAHGNPWMNNPNPERVAIGLRLGSERQLATGVGSYSDEAINAGLRAAGNGEILRPKGGVPNRVGPGMESNYALIKTQNGQILANSTSIAGHGGALPKITLEAELFTVDRNSMAARYSQKIQNRSANSLMRWAPPGMLGVFVWNVVAALNTTVSAFMSRDISSAAKGFTALSYGVTNLLYWLGHIAEASNLAHETRLSWLTNVRVDVTKIDNRLIQSTARMLFADRLLSVAKFAGVGGAFLEVVLAIWQGLDRLGMKDTDAAVGYFVSAGGFLVYMFSHLGGSATIPLLGLSFAAVFGILALAVALAALVWAIFRTDEALETWIKHGPFCLGEPAEEFGHLMARPDEAFEFLVGALYPVRGASRQLVHYEANGQLSEAEREWLSSEGRSRGQVVEINSAAFALMGDPETQFKAHFWKGVWTYDGKKTEIAPDNVFYDAEKLQLRFHFPPNRYVYVGRDQRFEKIRAKIQLATDSNVTLPVSDMEQPLESTEIAPGFSGDSARWLTI